MNTFSIVNTENAFDTVSNVAMNAGDVINTVAISQEDLGMAIKQIIIVTIIAIVFGTIERHMEIRDSLKFRDEYKELVYPIYAAFEIADMFEDYKTKVALLDMIDNSVVPVLKKRNLRSYVKFKNKKATYEFDRLFDFESNILEWSKNMRKIPVTDLEFGINEMCECVMQYFREHRKEIRDLFGECDITDIRTEKRIKHVRRKHRKKKDIFGWM